MRANTEPLAEVVRQRPDIKAGGALHTDRHPVVIEAHDLDRICGDGRRGGEGSWVRCVGWVKWSGSSGPSVT